MESTKYVTKTALGKWTSNDEGKTVQELKMDNVRITNVGLMPLQYAGRVGTGN